MTAALLWLLWSPNFAPGADHLETIAQLVILTLGWVTGLIIRHLGIGIIGEDDE